MIVDVFQTPPEVLSFGLGCLSHGTQVSSHPPTHPPTQPGHRINRVVGSLVFGPTSVLSVLVGQRRTWPNKCVVHATSVRLFSVSDAGQNPAAQAVVIEALHDRRVHPRTMQNEVIRHREDPHPFDPQDLLQKVRIVFCQVLCPEHLLVSRGSVLKAMVTTRRPP